MKRILLGLFVVGAVGGVAMLATNAFFSDTETSAGNTFTAGKLDLKVDYNSTYNGQTSTSWQAMDLTSAQKFFNFADVKPGDVGEGTISLHVDNNNAWGCVTITPTANDDNGLTGPESLAGDITDGPNQGELAQNMVFTIWADTCDQSLTGGLARPGDNIYQAECDKLLTHGPGPLAPVTWALADSVTPNIFTGAGALIGNTDYFIGMGWTLPGTVGNIVQSDSYKADISFYTEQQRNNPDFKCNKPVSDYVDIGNVTSEAGHNISTADWSDPWVKPGWGGNYGGGSSDSSLRLLMGKGDSLGCADPDAKPATFTMNAGTGTATKLTLEHLDGAVNDSFDVYIDNTLRGSYTATSTGGNEVWKTTTFTFPGVTGTVNVKLVATNEVAGWCADWGQVGFSNAKLE